MKTRDIFKTDFKQREVDSVNFDRFIGECLEVNADIVYMENNDEDKSPKFIRKLKGKYLRRKLIKLVEKFKDSNIVLNRNQLNEFFIYTFNNFPPNGEYGNIYRTQVIENNCTMATVLLGEENKHYKFLICIPHDENILNITCNVHTEHQTGQLDSKKFDVSLETLEDTPGTGNIIYILNRTIRKNIANYLLYILNSYQNKKEE